MDSIFDNHSNIFNLSDPQPTWLFNIVFQSDTPNADETLKDLIPISVGLPTYETILTTRSFLGTEKSYPIMRKYSGDTDMEFIIRTANENDELFKILASIKQTQFGYKHFELDRTFNKMIVQIIDKRGNISTTYKYYNIIITKFDLTNLSYEGEDMMKCTLSLHYDFWSKD